MRMLKYVGMSVLGVVAVAACGGDDEDKGPAAGGGASYADISQAIAEPTGTVDAMTVTGVGEEFEKISGAGAGGMREDAIAQNSAPMKTECPAGGSQTTTLMGDQQNATADIELVDCCYSAGCCTNGTGKWYIAAAMTDEYSVCGNYNLEYDCNEASATLAFSGCIGSNGSWVYLVEVNGETYAVSGSYSNGSGTLEIKGANGTYTCTYTDGAGTCTGGSGDFTF